MTLDEARAKQLESININIDFDEESIDLKRQTLEADYALLAATKACIEAQTAECPACNGCGGDYCIMSESMSYGWEDCPTCNGRGRVPK